MLLLANIRFQVAASNWLNMNQKESLLATYIFKYYVYQNCCWSHISIDARQRCPSFGWVGGENFPRYFLNSCSSDLLSWRSGIRMIWFGATHQCSNSVAAGKHLWISYHSCREKRQFWTLVVHFMNSWRPELVIFHSTTAPKSWLLLSCFWSA